MKEQKETVHMLELMMMPAFSVHEGRILYANQAAKQLMIQPDTEIAVLIPHGLQEYLAFSEGCLFLTLQLSGNTIGACVTKVNGTDIFVLEQEQSDLRTLALAAQSLRISIADLISLTDQTLPESDDPNLARINRKLVQLKRQVLNMADASRYGTSSPNRMCVIDVCTFLDELAQRVAPQVEATGMTLLVSIPNERILCPIDEEKLERAVYNLISNAIKANGPQGTVALTLSKKGRTLYLSVQDNGCGIPTETLGSIFTRYQRQPGLESSENGLGLGMVIVRAAAAVHGGTVLITQPPEGGTRVILSIPIRTDLYSEMRSPTLRIDYAGEKDHGLLELSDVLPPSFYAKRD
jgi:signal transduction histidine kinase